MADTENRAAVDDGPSVHSYAVDSRDHVTLKWGDDFIQFVRSERHADLLDTIARLTAEAEANAKDVARWRAMRRCTRGPARWRR